jgi:hypothetical protein
MGKDPEQKSGIEQREELEEETEGVTEFDESLFEQPYCPRCGWHNTRLSHTATLLDNFARIFGFRAFRCRSCGNRFRAIRRPHKS